MRAFLVLVACLFLLPCICFAQSITIVVTAGENISANMGIQYDAASDSWKKLTTMTPYRVQAIAMQDILSGDTGNAIISGVLQVEVGAGSGVNENKLYCISTVDSTGDFCNDALTSQHIVVGRAINSLPAATAGVVQVLINIEWHNVQADHIYPITVSIPSTTLTPLYDTLVDGKTEDLYAVFHIPTGLSRIGLFEFVVWYTSNVTTGNAWIAYKWHCEKYAGVYNAGGGTGSISGSVAAAAVTAPANAYQRLDQVIAISSASLGDELLNESVCVLQIERLGAHANDTMAGTFYVEGVELYP